MEIYLPDNKLTSSTVFGWKNPHKGRRSAVGKWEESQAMKALETAPSLVDRTAYFFQSIDCKALQFIPIISGL